MDKKIIATYYLNKIFSDDKFRYLFEIDKSDMYENPEKFINDCIGLFLFRLKKEFDKKDLSDSNINRILSLIYKWIFNNIYSTRDDGLIEFFITILAHNYKVYDYGAITIPMISNTGSVTCFEESTCIRLFFDPCTGHGCELPDNLYDIEIEMGILNFDKNAISSNNKINEFYDEVADFYEGEFTTEEYLNNNECDGEYIFNIKIIKKKYVCNDYCDVLPVPNNVISDMLDLINNSDALDKKNGD